MSRVYETEGFTYDGIPNNIVSLYDEAMRRKMYYFIKDVSELQINWKPEHARLRAQFLARARLHPPEVVRVIDIEATCKRERVVLIDYLADAAVQQVGYTAISHTYGMPVYDAFNCPCASDCYATVPRCSTEAICPHQDDASSATSEQHKGVVKDIIKMCNILREKGGVNYAWHDGVCIAQHDEAEVDETIKHIGWIYAYANETIVFLHYVGDPMAPIRNSDDEEKLCSRWHTRVWTLQEAALSKCRRYCVRVGPLGDCQTLEEFEKKMAVWYGDDCSTIQIMEEERFYEFVKEISRVLSPFGMNFLSIPNDDDYGVLVESNWMRVKVSRWIACLNSLIETLVHTCFKFPTMADALLMCCERNSKHMGDRTNSILALAEVKEFVAKKDEEVEASTAEFFKRQGQLGLAMAVFSINLSLDIKEKRQHTWLPILWESLSLYKKADLNIGYKVLEDGSMELRGELRCVKVRFTFHPKVKPEDFTSDPDDLSDPDGFTHSELPLNLTPSGDGVGKFDAWLPQRLSAICDLSPGFPVLFGGMLIPVVSGDHHQRPILSTEIKDRDMIQLCVVIPKGMAHCCLIVQGTQLDAHVSKVGLFVTPNDLFLDIVSGLHIGLAIDKLIIN